MDFNEFSIKLNGRFGSKLPFVAYCLAGGTAISAYLQKNDKLYHTDGFDTDGFVLAPFDFQENAHFIPKNHSEKIASEIDVAAFNLESIQPKERREEKLVYLSKLSETIQYIKSGQARKIVMSRVRDFPLERFSLSVLLERLFKAYPTAFRYIWYHPLTGLWCGATPETLVDVDNGNFKTMALAGTQLFVPNKPIIWGQKEIEEQRFVTDAIKQEVANIVSSLAISEPYTQRAGSLLHLRTDIFGALGNKTHLATLAYALHPTPAVCGTPRSAARDFILQNEGYPRQFYTGFLGPIYEDGAKASFMVNLRCMKITDGMARIFVGGGITAESQPELEWQETRNKMQTMLQVLVPML